MKRIVSILAVLALAGSTIAGAKDIDLKKYGAKADGKTKITEKFQKAIDEVSAAGGGRVILSGGSFVTAPITLKSGVEIYIDADAVLMASPDLEDYPERDGLKRLAPSDSLPRWRNVSLIYAEDAENVAISGRGVIDCNGHLFVKERTDPNWKGMQYERTVEPRKTIARVVIFAGCKNVTVSDVTMRNQPAGWSYWINDCDFVIFDRVKILAAVNYPNNDGIHINCSRNVSVSNSFIETGDDAIVIRANSRTINEIKSCERVVIANCTLRSWCNGIRIGWTNDGVIRNCTVSNVVMYDTSHGINIEFPKKAGKNDWGCEASLVENMTFSNIEMVGITGKPIACSVSPHSSVLFDSIRNIRFNEVHATARKFPQFKALPDHPFENFSFTNCTFKRVHESELPDWRRHGAGAGEGSCDFIMEHCKGFRFTNTEFETY